MLSNKYNIISFEKRFKFLNFKHIFFAINCKLIHFPFRKGSSFTDSPYSSLALYHRPSSIIQSIG